jgi:hypothetical protein
MREADALEVEYTEPAEAELDAAYEWLRSIDLEVAEKWLTGLTNAIAREAALLTSVAFRRPRAPDPVQGRDLYVMLYRTAGRRSSPWHVVYELADADEDGETDTLRVIRIRHAARG